MLGLFAAETGTGFLPSALSAPKIACIHTVDLATLFNVAASSPRRGRFTRGRRHVLLVTRLQRPWGQFDVLVGRTLKSRK